MHHFQSIFSLLERFFALFESRRTSICDIKYLNHCSRWITDGLFSHKIKNFKPWDAVLFVLVSVSLTISFDRNATLLTNTRFRPASLLMAEPLANLLRAYRYFFYRCLDVFFYYPSLLKFLSIHCEFPPIRRKRWNKKLSAEGKKKSINRLKSSDHHHLLKGWNDERNTGKTHNSELLLIGSSETNSPPQIWRNAISPCISMRTNKINMQK